VLPDPLSPEPPFCELLDPLLADPLLSPLPGVAPLCDELDELSPEPPAGEPPEPDDAVVDQPGTPAHEPSSGATPG
jgi:hypothetical protein